MGTPARLTIIHCGARRLKLSLSVMFSGVSRRHDVSVLTYSHFLVLMFVTELWWRDSLNRDRRLRVLHRNASTHSLKGRCLRTVVVRIVPLVAVDLSTSSVPPRLRLVQQSLMRISPSF